ncbi:hypothetical protein J2X36_002131 [Methylobacterium sp. BE186]|uniref:hypothetical protein n=1 Tax=Methylobacterium sp. BE186 TaxID=2817715 RepID=UPI002862478E|nr:hypothetical protein [Methylobacterium sp. BE186]MDR7037384.1 hypothetical protein [Methylobacterium sp. BE186]
MATARKRLKRDRHAISPRHREPHGDYQREPRKERTADVVAIALNQPHRRGQSKPEDPLLGSSLGRLYRRKLIDRDQHAIGIRYTMVATRYARLVLSSSPRIQGIDLNRAAGLACDDGPDDHDIARIREDMAGAKHALSHAAEPGEASRMLTIVCLLDEDIRLPSQIGSLKEGLNALSRMWR